MNIRSTTVRCLFFSAALAACILAGPSAAAQTSVVKFTLDQAVTNQIYQNQCNGETVLMNGSMHYEYFSSTSADGSSTDYHLTSMTTLKGVGQTTGASYVGNNSTNYHTVTKGASASDFSSTEKTRLVAQGPTPDMVLRQNLHVVIDPHGSIHADTSNATIGCK